MIHTYIYWHVVDYGIDSMHMLRKGYTGVDDVILFLISIPPIVLISLTMYLLVFF